MTSLLNNHSWPQGKWKIEYIQEIDKWRITTKNGLFIADVGYTLVANWMIAINNLYWGD